MAAAFLGESSGELLKFGFKPKGKRPPLTLEQKAAKAEKARRTREARHTMGPRQKAAIHGSPDLLRALELAPAVAAAEEPGRLFEAILDAAIELTGAERGSLVTVGGDDGSSRTG